MQFLPNFRIKSYLLIFPIFGGISTIFKNYHFILNYIWNAKKKQLLNEYVHIY